MDKYKIRRLFLVIACIAIPVTAGYFIAKYTMNNRHPFWEEWITGSLLFLAGILWIAIIVTGINRTIRYIKTGY